MAFNNQLYNTHAIIDHKTFGAILNAIAFSIKATVTALICQFYLPVTEAPSAQAAATRLGRVVLAP